MRDANCKIYRDWIVLLNNKADTDMRSLVLSEFVFNSDKLSSRHCRVLIVGECNCIAFINNANSQLNLSHVASRVAAIQYKFLLIR